jgi:hypothetical protein
MRPQRAITLVVALIMSVLVAWPVHAQEATPTVGGGAASFLPSAESLGEGWSTLPPAGIPNLNTNVFQQAAVGYYGGPGGARAVVMVFQVTEARVAIRQAWDEVSARYDTYRYAMTSDANRDLELATIPPPPGCEEVKRAEGTDSFAFVTAITLCAGADNVIVLAMVSGGDATTLRYEASDALASAAIARGSFTEQDITVRG